MDVSFGTYLRLLFSELLLEFCFGPVSYLLLLAFWKILGSDGKQHRRTPCYGVVFPECFQRRCNGREIRDVKAAVKKQWRMCQTVKFTIIMFDTFSKAYLLYSIHFLADSFFMLDAPNWVFPGMAPLFSLASESSTSL